MDLYTVLQPGAAPRQESECTTTVESKQALECSNWRQCATMKYLCMCSTPQSDKESAQVLLPTLVSPSEASPFATSICAFGVAQNILVLASQRRLGDATTSLSSNSGLHACLTLGASCTCLAFGFTISRPAILREDFKTCVSRR